ncbi:unnamed protein product, partial [Polarella glacialis]
MGHTSSLQTSAVPGPEAEFHGVAVLPASAHVRPPAESAVATELDGVAACLKPTLPSQLWQRPSSPMLPGGLKLDAPMAEGCSGTATTPAPSLPELGARSAFGREHSPPTASSLPSVAEWQEWQEWQRTQVSEDETASAHGSGDCRFESDLTDGCLPPELPPRVSRRPKSRLQQEKRGISWAPIPLRSKTLPEKEGRIVNQKWLQELCEPFRRLVALVKLSPCHSRAPGIPCANTTSGASSDI